MSDNYVYSMDDDGNLSAMKADIAKVLGEYLGKDGLLISFWRLSKVMNMRAKCNLLLMKFISCATLLNMLFLWIKVTLQNKKASTY